MLLRCSAEALALSRLLTYSAEPLTVPLLRMPRDAAERAVRVAAGIEEYCLDRAADPSNRVATASRIIHTALKRPDVATEVFFQLIRQTRGNPDPASLLRRAADFLSGPERGR